MLLAVCACEVISIYLAVCVGCVLSSLGDTHTQLEIQTEERQWASTEYRERLHWQMKKDFYTAGYFLGGSIIFAVTSAVLSALYLH